MSFFQAVSVKPARSYTMKRREEQRGLNFSIQKMREILKRDQYSLMEDADKNLYRMPSRSTEQVRAIYEAFGVRRICRFTLFLGKWKKRFIGLMMKAV